MLFGFEPSGCNFHYIHNRKPNPLGTPGSKLPKHPLCVRLVAYLVPELRRDFVSGGYSGFDAVDAALGEPMLDVAHQTLSYAWGNAVVTACVARLKGFSQPRGFGGAEGQTRASRHVGMLSLQLGRGKRVCRKTDDVSSFFCATMFMKGADSQEERELQ